MSDSSSDSSDDSVSSVSSVDSSDEEDNQIQQAPVENTWKEWAAGDWGYILNTKFCAFDKETTLNTRAWVVKLESLSAKECVVRWFKLIELGSNIYNWSSETWAEEKDALKPLYYVTVKNEKSVEVNDTFDPNFDFCAVCKDMGELICCSACPKSFHLKCAELSDTPNDEGWVCVNCKPYEKKKRKPRKSKNESSNIEPTEEVNITTQKVPPPPTTAGTSTPTKTHIAAAGPSSPSQEKTKPHKVHKSEHKKRHLSDDKSQDVKKRRKHEHTDINKSKPLIRQAPPPPLPGKPGPRVLMKTTTPRGPPNSYPLQINRTVTSINNSIKPSSLIKYTQKPAIPNTKPPNPHTLIGRGPSVLPTPSVRPNKLVLKTPLPAKPPSTTNGHTPSLLPGKHILPQSLQPHMKAPLLPSKPEPIIVTTTPISISLKLPSTTNPPPTPKSPITIDNSPISKVIAASPPTPPPKPAANPSNALSSILRVSPPHSPPIEELGSDDEKEKIPNLWDYVNKQLAAVTKQPGSVTSTTNKPVTDPRLSKVTSSPLKKTAVIVARPPAKVIIRPVDLYNVFPLFLKLHAPTSNVPSLNISQLIASAKVPKSKIT